MTVASSIYNTGDTETVEENFFNLQTDSRAREEMLHSNVVEPGTK